MPSSLVDFIWLVDKILLGFVISFSVATVAYAWVIEVVTQERVRALDDIKKNLRDLARKNPETFQSVFPAIASQFTSREFLQLSKSWDTIVPKELDHHFREHLLASGKIPELEHRARYSRSKWRRIEAIIAIGYVQSPDVLAILKEALRDKDQDVSYASMLALSHIKTSESARILLNFLKEHVFSGYKIVSLLENFPPAIADEILKASGSSNKIVRYWAVKLLSKFELEDRQARKIEVLTEDSSPDVRAAACECLGNLRGKDAKVAISKCLHDRVWFVRMHAVRAFSKIFGPESISELIKLMASDSSEFVKESVKNAIIVDIHQAISYIEQCLDGNDQVTKKYCIDALVDSNYVITILGDLLSEDKAVQKSAICLLERMAKSNIYFGLKKSLDMFRPHSRGRILEVLKDIDPVLAARVG